MSRLNKDNSVEHTVSFIEKGMKSQKGGMVQLVRADLIINYYQ